LQKSEDAAVYGIKLHIYILSRNIVSCEAELCPSFGIPFARVTIG